MNNEICIGYASENGMVDKLCHELSIIGNKKITFLDESISERYFASNVASPLLG